MEPHESQVESIFFAALERPTPEERSAYVADACEGDDNLRQRVDRLLNAHPRIGSFLQPPVGAAYSPTVSDAPLSEAPGTEIGPYRLLEQIGEGGFGVVFMAEQTAPVKRKVALKVIKPGMDTREVIARFEAERQALALMDHPNIAKVLDAGATETGRPFFVMELVHGVPITEYCDQHHLSPRERLELFVTVCQAVQHAHQKGIIHRDIKPTNVLVTRHDDRPLVKVIDFGIAKAVSGQLTDKTLFTGFAQLVGTPLYMSPEQAAMAAIDVDTRSDIYSLGVLLYELLTGTTPFDKSRLQQAAFEEIRRIIREEEPQKPSLRLSSLGDTMPSVSAVRKMEPRKLSQLVRGDLDWIVMKALEKDRGRRYETANGFAADVLRYLADEPVEACPPSAAYRFRKFVRRNKAPFMAGVAVLIALVIGIIGTTSQAVRATRAEADARTAQQEAEENFRKARAAVDDYFTRVSGSTLLQRPDLEPMRKELLEDALRYYQGFVEDHADDPELRADLAATLFHIGMLQYELGQDWVPTFRQGVATLEELMDTNPDLDGLGSLCEGSRSFGAVALWHVRQPDETLEALDRARILWERLAREHPAVPAFRSDLAMLLITIAALKDGDRPAEAVAPNEAAAELFRELADEYPEAPRYRIGQCIALVNLSVMLAFVGRHQEADEARRQSVEIAEGLSAAAPGVTAVQELNAYVQNEVAFGLALADRLAEAELAWRRMLVIEDSLIEQHPDVPRYRSWLFWGHRALADVLWRMGRRDEAAEIHRELATLGERLDPEEFRFQDFRAWVLANCRNEQFRDVERAIEIAAANVEQVPAWGTYWTTLGAAQYRAGLYEDAIETLEKSLSFRSNFRAVAARLFLAMACWQQGDQRRAREWYDEAVAYGDEHHLWWSEPRQIQAEARELIQL